MKILALNWRDPLHPEAGGAEVHLDKILTYLATKHEVVLVSTMTSSQKETLKYNGYLIKRIGHPLLFNFTFRFQWNKEFSHENFDIVIDDISKIGLQTPKYIKNTPILSIFHHIHGHTLFKLLPLPMAIYVYTMERIALKTYKKTPVVVVSESSKQELLNLSNFQNLHIIPNGIDKEYLALRKSSKKSGQLCSVGRLTSAKRVDLAIDTFKKVLSKYPDSRLKIAGKGNEESNIKNYAQKLNIAHAIDFMGYISEKDKKTLLEESEAMVFTSEKEGWGIVAIESSACSTPVFGFDVAGIRDSVKNDINGKLVPFGDTDKLAEVIIDYLDSSQKNILQGQSYCYAKNFDWDKITQEFELLLYNLL